MSTPEPVITDLFASPESWENPYPGYARFRGDSPIVAEWPVTMLDGTRFKVQTWMLLQYDQVSVSQPQWVLALTLTVLDRRHTKNRSSVAMHCAHLASSAGSTLFALSQSRAES